MTLNDYQKKAKTTYIANNQNNQKEEVCRLILGLVGESGEVAEKVKKYLRGDYDFQILSEQVKKELGDVLWYLALLADEVGIDLESVGKTNLQKLQKRKISGTIKGSGDDR